MSAASPDNGLPSSGPLPERHETTDGTTFWGDIPEERFQNAADQFPVLKYVIEAYFGSPERKRRDGEFLVQYDTLGEESAEFNGFMDDLDAAIKKYTLASALINGLMAADMAPTEMRTQLVALKDQISEQGDYAAPEPAEDKDPFLINSAQDRVNASFLWRREIPIGPLKGRPQPLAYYGLAGLALVVVGLLATEIPFGLAQTVGKVVILLGAAICLLIAVGTLALRSSYMHPDQEAEREAVRAEESESKTARRGRGSGFLSRLNPFTH